MIRAAFLLALSAAAPAAAQPAACDKVAPPAGFEGWERTTATRLALEQRATLALQPASGLALTPPPARTAPPGSYGGAFPLEIGTAGTYRVALSGKAWIELVAADGRRVPSTAHAMGPACSGIAKIVSFALAPGRYTVQLTEAPAAQIMAMVVPAS